MRSRQTSTNGLQRMPQQKHDYEHAYRTPIRDLQMGYKAWKILSAIPYVHDGTIFTQKERRIEDNQDSKKNREETLEDP
jgi:hypothetical protein